MKICKKCEQEKPVSEFYLNKKTGKYGPYCKPCAATYRREWVKKNPKRAKELQKEWKERYPEYHKAYEQQPHRKATIRDRHLKYSYGITKEEWNNIFEAQGRLCATCLSPDPKSKTGWHTDHCHTTGAVRGILCQPCNTGLGQTNDSIPILRAMIAYLERNKTGTIPEDFL